MAYVYSRTGTTYHTENCRAVKAFDTRTKLAGSKSELPAGRRLCDMCQRGVSA